jgi:large subunit ribosomal protein L21
MNAIIKIGNNQYKIFPKQSIYVPFLKKQIGKKIFLKKILLFKDKKNIFIGNPFLKKIKIKIKILDYLKGKKFFSFKKKRRKGFKKKKGYRENFTKIKILYIKKK